MVLASFQAPVADPGYRDGQAATVADEHFLCAIGQSVEVRTRYLPGCWSRGFSVVEVVPGGYRIRRMSDRAEFPEAFAADDVRPYKT